MYRLARRRVHNQRLLSGLKMGLESLVNLRSEYEKTSFMKVLFNDKRKSHGLKGVTIAIVIYIDIYYKCKVYIYITYI